FPVAITTMMSASAIVDSRWATMQVVRSERTSDSAYCCVGRQKGGDVLSDAFGTHWIRFQPEKFNHRRVSDGPQQRGCRPPARCGNSPTHCSSGAAGLQLRHGLDCTHLAPALRGSSAALGRMPPAASPRH
ncbi:hypothetical protein Vretifemale_15558, partial [Volvox reticuliferus]